MTTTTVTPEAAQQAVIQQPREFAEGVRLLNACAAASIQPLARLCFYRELALQGRISG